MTNPADQVLDLLLTSYERRKKPLERAISVPISKVTGYLDKNDPAVRNFVNQQLEIWEKTNWVDLRWERNERGNLLNRVTLIVSATPEIYAYLGRIPAQRQHDDLYNLLTEFQPQMGVEFAPVIDQVIENLKNGKSINPFKIDDQERNEALLKVLVALNLLDDELPERIFSSHILGDSKYFSRLKSSLLILIRQAYPHFSIERPALVWAAFGILPNPGHVYISGPLKFALSGSITDVCVFHPDIGIPVHSIPDFNIVSHDAPYILTIENQTSYYDFLQKINDNGLIVYLGGFPSRTRQELLRKLITFSPNIPFYHWGDLDYGGLSILSYLRRFLKHRILPHQMDTATFETYLNSGKKLSTADCRNLQRLLADEFLKDLKPVIERMLNAGMKLEQENIAVEAITTG